MNQKVPHQPLVLFDGVCNLCSGTVRFIIRRDLSRQFRFSSLQSDLGERLLEEDKGQRLESMLLVFNDQVYRKSTAALHILKLLGGAWAAAYIFIVIPRPLRDWVYDFIGSRRYKWFGKTEQCWLPEQDVSDRFL